MPELPEVQTVVNDLNRKVVGRKITGIWFDWPKTIKGNGASGFERKIKGEKILNVKRRGKNILIYLTGGKLLLIHQKMTGHMLVGRWNVKCQRSNVKCQIIPLEPKAVVEDPQNRFIHLILYLDDGGMLALSDLRKFAKVILGKVEDIENLPELANLGPDALDSKLTFGKFKVALRPASPKLQRGEQAQGRKIKQVLMDQEVIAGIGNIYSDDILWMARIHPFRPVNKLSDKELKVIYRAMRDVLKLAVKLRGTSTSDFRDTAGESGYYTEERKVYQREGEPCPRRDGGKIKRVKLGGRSAHYCPRCQVL